MQSAGLIQNCVFPVTEHLKMNYKQKCAQISYYPKHSETVACALLTQAFKQTLMEKTE